MDWKRLFGSEFDSDAALELFRTIKHTRLEGMVMEHEFDQALLVRAEDFGWKRVPALVLKRGFGFRNDFLVVALEEDESVFRLAASLRRTGDPVMVGSCREDGIFMLEGANGVRLRDPKLMLCFRGDVETAEKATVIEDRVLAAYWGFAAQSKGIARRFCEALFIKDYIVGPSCRALWDLDCFLMREGSIVYIEGKHKYPFQGAELGFGMNVGEVTNAEQLSTAGFGVFHVILVKPVWDARMASSYLFFNRRARERALWLVGNMADPGFFGKVGEAPRETSLHGRHRLTFQRIGLESLRFLGSNSDSSEDLSESFFRYLEGVGLPMVTGGMLRVNRMSSEAVI